MKLHRLLPGGICWCLLAWLAVVVPLPASADVVVGGLGGVPMGGESQFEASGGIRMGSSLVSWAESGQGNDAFIYLAPGDGNGRVTLAHKSVDSSSSPLDLVSSSRVQAQLMSSGSVQAFGWSQATVNDVVYAQNSSGNVISGVIKFDWKTTGTLKLHANSVDYPLNIQNGVNFGYLAQAQIFVNWIDRSGETQGSLAGESRFGSSFLRGDATRNQWNGHTWLDAELAVQADRVFNDNDYQHEISKHVSETHSFRENVLAFEGFPVQIMLGLMTSYNLYAELIDHTGLDIGSEAMFDHTSTLESVQFFNPDGTPYVGQWTLVSANGIDYPELIVTDIGVVPLPGTLALALVGLWPALRMQRVRSRPRLSLARIA